MNERGQKTIIDRHMTPLAQTNMGHAKRIKDQFYQFWAGKTRSNMEYLLAIQCSPTVAGKRPAEDAESSDFAPMDNPDLKKVIRVYIVYWDQDGSKDHILGDHFKWSGNSPPTVPFMVFEATSHDFGHLVGRTTVEACFPEEVKDLGRLDTLDLARNVFCAVKPLLGLYHKTIVDVCTDCALHDWLVDMWTDLGFSRTDSAITTTLRYTADTHRIICDDDAAPVVVNLDSKKLHRYEADWFKADCIPRLLDNAKVYADTFSDSPLFRLSSIFSKRTGLIS